MRLYIPHDDDICLIHRGHIVPVSAYEQAAYYIKLCPRPLPGGLYDKNDSGALRLYVKLLCAIVDINHQKIV